jgi:ABC-2 type transport system ATP-binding protein
MTTAMAEAAVLEFRDVMRAYTPGVPVVNGVSFAVRRDEVVALVGRNGTGKTTLIHLAMGMLHAQRGSVRAFGMDPTRDPVAVRRRIGYVGDQQILPATFRVMELVALHRALYPGWDAALERTLLARFGLAGSGAKLSQLSRGQVQQLALLCAVCHHPELLILDEPASGLDPAARREFLETSIQLLNSEGTAILFSTHHMADVERLGGRVLLLAEGTIRVDRALDDLRERYTVAQVPRRGAADDVVMGALPGCLRVRAVGAEWHAVYEDVPEQVERMLREALGTDAVYCTSVPLEELFIELLGGERAPVHAGVSA